ncbi:WxL protein peptidoglycan domain-containing protein [Amycolatopsis thermoflava]|uniref:Uncharacterized protein DUF916 n=1 Tax=Amycolatopsis thermoflava TaxID=84480 RepID=A0A3N2GPW9_9PSEU|nr:DUF916 domain-containing protein [Amycolatopsis thermoflava]ROS38672.1 uncharacterized protein DUF916 [Amycolatopsis thermoflava]
MLTLRAAAVAAAALFAVLTGAVPATAQDDVPWSVATADGEFGSDRVNYNYTLDPGEQLTDGLVVTNNGSGPLDLAVYAADAFTTTQGKLDLVTRDTASTGVGAWVSPAAGSVTVQPGQSSEVPFTLAVPAGATPGDRMGGIVTSLVQDGVERRVGIRIRLRVGGALTPGVSAEDVRVDYSGGDAVLTYTVHNTGNAIVAVRQSASVSGPFGSWAHAADPVADTPSLLPGEKWPVSVPVHGVVPAVWLTGSVTLTPLLTDAAGSTAVLPAVAVTTHGWAVPWVPLVIVLCGLAVVVFLVRRRTRNRRAAPREEPADPVPAA